MTDGPGWTPPEQAPGSWPPPPSQGSWQAPPPPGQGPWQAPPPGQGTWPPPGQGPPSWPPPGYGGYGAPWPPPAPKPGVIPLRPIGLGELLDGSINTIRRNPKATLGFTAVIMAVSTVISTALTAAGASDLQRLSQRTSAGQPLTVSDIRPMVGWLATAGVVTLLLALSVSVILTGILTAVVGRAVLGQNITARQAWQQARGRLGALLGLILLVLAIFIGLWVVPLGGAVIVLFAASASAGVAVLTIVPIAIAMVVLTIFLWVRTSLAAPVVVLERAGPATAIGRSWRLTNRSFWRMFGIWLVTYLATSVAGFVLEVPFRLLQSAITGSGGLGAGSVPPDSVGGGKLFLYLVIGGVGGLVAATVTRPLVAGVAVLLYVDLRMRREGLDMALQTAAGHEQAPGDEFAAVWRPPAPGSWQPPASWQGYGPGPAPWPGQVPGPGPTPGAGPAPGAEPTPGAGQAPRAGPGQPPPPDQNTPPW
ncbi:MAG: hypothetical protein ACM3ML_15410 [Micromonosporaceae bacterium]